MLFENPTVDMIAWGVGFAMFVLVWQWVADRTWTKPRHGDRALPPAE
jgi:hypothetical protein